MSAAAQPALEAYPSFNEFFTRALKPGARPLADAAFVCPVDGAISQFGVIARDQIYQAKGHTYSTRALVGGDAELAGLFDHGAFATIYLSPKDYHRIHMPAGGRLRQMIHVPGDLFSVNPATARGVPGLFARNERVVCVFESEQGPFVLTDPAERALLLQLSRFAEEVPRVLEDFRPNLLSNYLFETATSFHSFFEACPVLRSEGEAKNVILGALGGHYDIKHVTVVDLDVDIHDPTEVEWAIATRFQADRDLVIDGAAQLGLADSTAAAPSSVAATATSSFVQDLDVSSYIGAQKALEIVDKALESVNSVRADLGAIQNRFTSVVANLQTSSENLSASRSRIRDTDFAKETAELTRTQILQQAGTAMLAQANQVPQNVLSLLR